MKMRTIFSLFILLFLSFSCSEMNLDLPSGPEGKSAYELWVDGVSNGQIEWSKDKTQIEHFYLYMKGQDGKSGLSAYELWIKEVDKGINDPHNPGKQWNKNKTELNDFWYFLTGADGKNGSTPQIGDNGNWWIDGEDTEIPASGKDGQDGEDGKDGTGGKGQDGEDGRDPDVTIGDNGNWWIDGIDTGKPAFGKDGQAAYELWKEEVAAGLKNPHDEDGGDWPKDKTSVQDFWEYLSGKDGQDGEDCECCDPCGPDCGDCEEPIIGMANVLIMPQMPGYIEFDSGEVTYTVYDDAGEYAPFAKVKGMPGMDPEKEFIADELGDFIIHNKDLPEGRAENKLKGTATVTYHKVIEGGKLVTEESAANTHVPNRVRLRLTLVDTPVNETGYSTFKVKMEQNTGYPTSKWESMPHYLEGDIEIDAYELNDKNDPTSYDIDNPLYSAHSGDPYPSYHVTIPRYAVRPSYLTKAFHIEYEWTTDYQDHYYIALCKSLYGEEVIAPIVIKGSTQQYMPLFNAVSVSGDFTPDDQPIIAKELKFTFDVSSLKDEHIFKSQYVIDETMSVNSNGIDYKYYIPELAGDDFYTRYRTNFRVLMTYHNPAVMEDARLTDPEVTLKDVIIFDNNEEIPVSIYTHPTSAVLHPHKSWQTDVPVGNLVYDKATNTLEFKGINKNGYKTSNINVTKH